MKALLLDTHVWLWSLVQKDRLPGDLLDRLAVPEQDVCLSAASSWEVSIKYRIGKLPLPEPPATFIGPRLLRDQIRFLPVDLRHTVEVAELEDHHSDPFDRLLVAQALVEDMVLVTADGRLKPYPAEIWLI